MEWRRARPDVERADALGAILGFQGHDGQPMVVVSGRQWSFAYAGGLLADSKLKLKLKLKLRKPVHAYLPPCTHTIHAYLWRVELMPGQSQVVDAEGIHVYWHLAEAG